MLELDNKICSDFTEASSREWLETNGLGSYASGTISGVLTRRYHGLLVEATDPPLGRVVTISKVEELLVLDGERYELSTNQYSNAVHPHGYRYLTGFRLDPFPVWTFEVAGMEIERTLFMVHGENSTVIQWKLNELRPGARIEVRPLVAFRDHHHLLQGDTPKLEFDFDEDVRQLSIQPSAEMPRIYFASNAIDSEPQEFWYRDFDYSIEAERGFQHKEDLYQPFKLEFDLADDATLILTTSHTRSADDAGKLRRDEIQRRAELVARSKIKDKALWPLVLAADQFVVDRGAGKSVMAGYHWFSDWGRDTMIALPGLALSINRPEVARNILIEYSHHISDGMVPNRFPDSGAAADYNTVDATLWFFEAIRAYAAKTADFDTVREHLYDRLAEIIEWHVAGTRYGIHVDADGLLYAGEPGVQLTWMDAKIDDWVVTPRTGKPVEIQALWYNALRIMADMAEHFGDRPRRARYSEMANVARQSFNGQFWNVETGCLYDVVRGSDKDASIRPNQIFAVSLPHTMLNEDSCRSVVNKVESELLTPVGLRSLSPHDSRFVGVYEGSPRIRDAAYHQGTVWAWLIGHFIEAYRRVHGEREATKARVAKMTAGLMFHLSEAMVGQVSEIFDAVPPYRSRGCAAQAWSVAELLRVLKMS
jgi:predicted glycogen debranching enzyme